MTAFRYNAAAADLDDALLELVGDHNADKLAAEPAPAAHPSDGALARIKRTPLDDVRDVLAKKKPTTSRDPQAAALLDDVLDPQKKTAELDEFLAAATVKEM